MASSREAYQAAEQEAKQKESSINNNDSKKVLHVRRKFKTVGGIYISIARMKMTIAQWRAINAQEKKYKKKQPSRSNRNQGGNNPNSPR